MSTSPFPRWQSVYRHDGHRLRVHGRKTDSSHEFRRYVQTRVRDRLRRASSREHLREYLNELASTGFSVTALQSASSDSIALEPWEIGEVLAELLLEETEGAEFPWPPSWDKRSATASLPGPDLIGFVSEAGALQFLFGEVKSSDADDVHGSVIHGPTGLRKQIEALLISESRRQLLIAWLCVRADGQAWKPQFNRCLIAYLSNHSAASVVGVLLRGRDPSDTDLGPVRAMCEVTTSPYKVLLVGYYLPTPLEDLPAALAGTVERP